MEINVDIKRLKTSSLSDLITFFQDNEAVLELNDSQLYYDFPILKDADDEVVIAQLLLISRKHGILAISASDLTSRDAISTELTKIETSLDNVFTLLYSRLIRNKNLKMAKTELAFAMNSFIFAPLLDKKPEILNTDVFISAGQIIDYVNSIKGDDLTDLIFAEVISTVEGAKGINRPKPREVANLKPNSKGDLANRIEAEITRFDKQQKQGAMTVLDGFQRIRGLAGSGKTVVLAMKAALTHLRDPQANIVYTFYTKALYQHIKRLITRFYRQFEDRDPDWSRLNIIHGWGGSNADGVYSNACNRFNVTPITFREASLQGGDPFDYVCSNFLSTAKSISPMYDYIFIDEGQDFPPSFIRLCIQLSQNERVVFAYDDLQTIFQPTAPAIKDIVGKDKNGQPLTELIGDVVLDKCYRNPREILVCAHALGFGIYANIVQMLENKEQWEDVGYKVSKGDFVEGSFTEIERPEANSLKIISGGQRPEEIIKVKEYSTFEEEINSTIAQVILDIKEGLRPDDILIISVDDRNAKIYFRDLSFRLSQYGIPYHNVHDDSYGIKDFQKDGKVTLSTVHKAKGNEAFMVYVLGVDALYSTYAGPRERNVLFTAMTRAKGWVRISGVGIGASECVKEVTKALAEFPFLRFEYPNPEKLKIIKRDLISKSQQKNRVERKLDEVLDVMSPEDVLRFIEQRSIKKGK